MLQTLALVGAGLLSGSGDYAWPLSLDRQLSSSFAEYRTGRFHAGIDLRTAGVGREVVAAGDGYVSRVRCSPYGYGKAVYLQLADGNVAVYAHLSDFYGELSDHVRKHQHRLERYTVDLHLEPNQFPVRKGQLIARSGQTGIGAPHLHFEMRDGSHAPVNPRLLGFDWPDTTPPRIDRILVAPQGLKGRVNGDVVPVALDVVRDEQGDYRTQPVRASGAVGFGADVVDPGSGGHKLGVHQLRLLSEDAEVFRVQHDRLDYSNHRNGAVSYHPHLLDQGRFLLLWRWPGNRCESYQHSAGDGWASVEPGASEFIVEAVDFHGNSTRVTVPVAWEEPGAEGSGTGGSDAISLDVWGPELLVSARVAQPSSVPPRLRTGDGDGTPFVALGAGQYRTAFRPARTGRYTLSVAHGQLPAYTTEVAAFIAGQGPQTLELGDVQVTAGPRAPYGALILRAWEETSPPAHPMPARSAAYRVWPSDAPIFDPITVSIPLAEGTDYNRAIHIYRHRGSHWTREDTTYRNGRLAIETRSPGLFIAMEDRTPPSVANVSPPEGYAATTRRPIVRADVSDSGSGITDFEIRCGDQWLLAAYDPGRGLLHWERDEDLPPGPQTLTYTLTDAAGNTRTYTRQVVIPE